MLRFSSSPSFAFATLLGGFAVAATLLDCADDAKPPADTTGIGTVSPGGNGSGSSLDAGTDAACGFAVSPTSFALPPLLSAPVSPFSAVTNQLDCPSVARKLDYSLTDMNADGQPDLLLTSTCDDATIGVTAWLVYVNEGTGFATTPSRFPLPPATTPANCATTSIFDLNGDGLLDFVVTALCSDATVGSSRWLVYSGATTGFAQTAAPFELPPGYSAGAFKTVGVATDECSATSNVPAFSVFDLNGDGARDFVVMQACADATVGTTAWLVYAGGSPGAAQTASRFALPSTPAVTTGAFGAPAASLACTAAITRPSYDLLDFDVDGRPDLVATQECPASGDTTVGTSSWLWYRNGGEGFAASPATVALPAITGVPASSYTALAATGTCANGTGAPSYTLADIDGDAILDLLVTRDCSDALSGVAYWEVFPRTGSGFAAPPRKLTLPAALSTSTTGAVGLSGASQCTSPQRPAFTATSLTGEKLDLVITSVCTDSTVGSSRWLVFPGGCE